MSEYAVSEYEAPAGVPARRATLVRVVLLATVAELVLFGSGRLLQVGPLTARMALFAFGVAMAGLHALQSRRIDAEVWARTLVNGTPPEQWRDRDLPTFDVRLREVASGFVRLEELVAEKVRVGEDGAQILRVGILNGQAREARELIAVNSERAAAVEDLVDRLARVLGEGPDQGEEGRRIRLAALARVTMEHLRVEGDG